MHLSGRAERAGTIGPGDDGLAGDPGGRRDGVPGHSSSDSTGFSSEPIPEIVARSVSPGRRYRLVDEPTPEGVPVEMMSPGSRVTNRERKETMAATGKIILEVDESCITSSLTESWMERV